MCSRRGVIKEFKGRIKEIDGTEVLLAFPGTGNERTEVIDGIRFITFEKESHLKEYTYFEEQFKKVFSSSSEYYKAASPLETPPAVTPSQTIIKRRRKPISPKKPNKNDHLKSNSSEICKMLIKVSNIAQVGFNLATSRDDDSVKRTNDNIFHSGCCDSKLFKRQSNVKEVGYSFDDGNDSKIELQPKRKNISGTIRNVRTVSNANGNFHVGSSQMEKGYNDEHGFYIRKEIKSLISELIGFVEQNLSAASSYQYSPFLLNNKYNSTRVPNKPNIRSLNQYAHAKQSKKKFKNVEIELPEFVKANMDDEVKDKMSAIKVKETTHVVEKSIGISLGVSKGNIQLPYVLCNNLEMPSGEVEHDGQLKRMMDSLTLDDGRKSFHSSYLVNRFSFVLKKNTNEGGLHDKAVSAKCSRTKLSKVDQRNFRSVAKRLSSAKGKQRLHCFRRNQKTKTVNEGGDKHFPVEDKSELMASLTSDEQVKELDVTEMNENVNLEVERAKSSSEHCISKAHSYDVLVRQYFEANKRWMTDKVNIIEENSDEDFYGFDSSDNDSAACEINGNAGSLEGRRGAPLRSSSSEVHLSFERVQPNRVHQCDNNILSHLKGNKDFRRPLHLTNRNKRLFHSDFLINNTLSNSGDCLELFPNTSTSKRLRTKEEALIAVNSGQTVVGKNSTLATKHTCALNDITNTSIE